MVDQLSKLYITKILNRQISYHHYKFVWYT